MGSDPTLPTLFGQLEPGEQREFKVYYDTLQELLLKTSERILSANGVPDYVEQARDCVHEAFVELLNAICHRLRPFSEDSGGPSHVRNWLFRVNVNISIDHIRQVRRKPVSSFDPDYLLVPQQNSRRFDDVLADQSLIKDLVEQLSPREQTYLWLKYRDGMSPQEIGDLVGIPANTVCQTQRRSLEKLRKALKDAER
jgi:RNA polymerase sigma factor (sigma-70 family)